VCHNCPQLKGGKFPQPGSPQREIFEKNNWGPKSELNYTPTLRALCKGKVGQGPPSELIGSRFPGNMSPPQEPW